MCQTTKDQILNSSHFSAKGLLAMTFFSMSLQYLFTINILKIFGTKEYLNDDKFVQESGTTNELLILQTRRFLTNHGDSFAINWPHVQIIYVEARPKQISHNFGISSKKWQEWIDS